MTKPPTAQHCRVQRPVHELRSPPVRSQQRRRETVAQSSMQVSVTVPATMLSLPSSPQSGSGVDNTSKRSPSRTASLKGSAVGTGVGLGIGVGMAVPVGVRSDGAASAGATVAVPADIAAGIAAGPGAAACPTVNHQIRRPSPARGGGCADDTERAGHFSTQSGRVEAILRGQFGPRGVFRRERLPDPCRQAICQDRV